MRPAGTVRGMKRMMFAAIVLLIWMGPPGAAQDLNAPYAAAGLRPPARDGNVPRTRWRHQPEHVLWNRAALSALKGHGRPLVEMVPGDIADWCPRYPQATAADRRAFWVGFLSSLAKYESTYRADAVGGGGRYDGLVGQLGGKATPAVGWAIGMERLIILLQKLDRDIEPSVDFFIVSKGDRAEAQALELSHGLRRAGFTVELDLSASAFGKQFRQIGRAHV